MKILPTNILMHNIDKFKCYVCGEYYPKDEMVSSDGIKYNMCQYCDDELRDEAELDAMYQDMVDEYDNEGE
jgi:NAD-dependent SIR2 family protein deacetylase